MRVVVTGASGNVGTSLLPVLANNQAVTEIVGICRRKPTDTLPKVRWEQADVATSDLDTLFAGADAVVHLAWQIRPSHREDVLRRVNVNGSKRVFEAAIKAGAKAVVHASSVGTYSPGAKTPINEAHPTSGIATSTYSRHKARVERILDAIEAEHPEIRWVRMRPSLIFKRESAQHIRRVFLGNLYPVALLRHRPLPVIPKSTRFILPIVHTDDVAAAINAALIRDVRGAFNLSAEPPLDGTAMAQIARGVALPVPERVLRALAHITWRLHLQPTEPGWIDLALQTPLLDSHRARTELDWQPKVTAGEAFAQLIEGMRYASDFPTPPMTLFRQMGVRTSIDDARQLVRTRQAPQGPL